MTEDNNEPAKEEPLDVAAVVAAYRRRQTIEHLLGPLLSFILHVIVIMAGVALLVGKPMEDYDEEIEVVIEELDIKELDPKVLEELQKLEQIAEEVVPTVDKPQVPHDVVETVSTDDFSDEMAETDEEMDVSDVLDMKASDTPLKISGLYGGRTNAGRQRLLRRGGGSTVTESAVLRALRWLKEHQNPDGSWSKSQPVAMTGLALLTYLAHGETPLSEEFGVTVQKAMQNLSARMMAATQSPGCGGRAYTNGVATYALAEAYGLTRIPFLKPAMEQGLGFIVQGQQKNTGGWDYRYAKGKRWDLSVSGWQVQALKGGYVAGADTPGLAEAIEKSAQFLRKVTFKDGAFGYSEPGKGSWGMQGAGTLCLQLIGEGRSVEARAGVKNISENDKVVWDDEREYLDHSNPAYNWYYETQAMFHGGQASWRNWNKMFSRILVQNQKSDGHWDCPGRVTKDRKRPEYDPYYTTCLCCLSLQVYYRYLPTYKMPQAVAAKPGSALDDVGDEALGVTVE